jgi:hypothetical protein
MQDSNIFFDFKPVVINDFFTEEEIESIYKTRFEIAPGIKNGTWGDFVFADPNCGYITSVYKFEDSIRRKIVNEIAKRVPIYVREDGNHMPRYTLDSGSKPSLLPHCDVNMKTASYTLSIQLKATMPWDLYVEGESYSLDFNQALLFSGSHQIHWRPDIEFDKSDYYDIIVCQVVEDTQNPLLLDSAHRAIMQTKANFYMNKFFKSYLTSS